MIRIIGYLFGIGTVGALLVAAGVAVYIQSISEDLPDYEVLANYEPPVTTRLHASDGQLMAEYAREKRLFLPIQAIPDRVKAAFISAEDKNFYSHPGVDIQGLARAVVTNFQNYGSGKGLVGASTITQQVAKNFLLSSKQTIDRKVREAILALRIEQAYSKDRILELYLNEIFFGRGAYGIAGAALTYYDKSVNELTLSETAYLAGIIKGPANYDPFDDTEAALERRNYVIDRIVDNGYVTAEEGSAAKAEPLNVKVRRGGTYLAASEYFTEEVRRDIIARYGEDALYEGGLSVRTTIDPRMQMLARTALQRGLVSYDRLRGYRGPLAKIDADGDWGVALSGVKGMSDMPQWLVAVVLDANADGITAGIKPQTDDAGKLVADRKTVSVAAKNMKWAFRGVDKEGNRVSAKSPDGFLSKGDVVYLEEVDGEYLLRQEPAVGGALVAMDPNTGRVLAMVGGFSFSSSQFNRATQAKRQPGSSFKPFVYAAALDNGYTPASVVLDGPIKIEAGGELWEPKNYGGGFAGPQTLRLGIERSRNLMTVRLAKDMGMSLVAEYAERFGVYDKMLPVLSASLGSNETTVQRMVSAYAVFANGGRRISPSIIDRIQDRYGKTVYRHDERVCEGCQASAWINQPEPTLIDEREQVLDPMTAYQITSMMEGVVQRGTAVVIKDIGRPVAGKTGTSNDEKDAWFVGYTPDLVVGVFVGFDNPKPMGKGATGGGLAAPIFKEFVQAALKDVPPVEFKVPEGMNLIPINRKTGMRANVGAGDVILEAFKPGTGPADSYSVIGGDEVAVEVRATKISPKAKEAISNNGGGLF
jgi:penicillin-binding protein 1A